MKNHKIKSMFIICIFFILSNIFLFQTTVYAKSNGHKKLLIFNSLSKGNTLSGFTTNNWNDQITSGLESKLKKNKLNVDVRVEYMDSTFNNSDEYYHMLYNLYKYKYNTNNFDAIIAISNDAMDFLNKYADDLFPNTPVVFSGVDQSRKSFLKNHVLFTGLYKSDDYNSTLDIALTLHPNAKHFFLITQRKSNYGTMLDPLTSSNKNNVDFTYCTDTDINNVKEKIDALSDDAIIFIGTQFRNSENEIISIHDATNILFKNCRLPVYATGYSYLNNGIIGGMLTSGTKLGESLGDITSKILNGEKPSDIPAIIDNSHNYVFDINQLNRFNINMSCIPKDSEIINMPASTYSIPKKVILCFLIGFISMLILIIILLLFIIRKLKNTKNY